VTTRLQGGGNGFEIAVADESGTGLTTVTVLYDGQPVQSVDIEVQRVKIIMSDGSELPGELEFKSGEARSFRLVSEDGMIVPVDYSKVTLGSSSNADVVVTVSGEGSSFAVTAVSDVEDAKTSVPVFYRGQPAGVLPISMAAAGLPGSYPLESVNGSPLPAVGYDDEDTRSEYTAGELVLEADLTFRYSLAFKVTDKNTGEVWFEFESGNGRYEVNGTSLVLQLTHTDGEPEDETFYATISGGLITLYIEEGMTLEFRRR
jgi:hypothetical protein